RSETVHGQPPERSSPRTCLRTRSRSRGRARRTRRGMQPAIGTTELALPGLDVVEPVTGMKPGHWIERGPSKRLMVFAGRSPPDLAHRIAEQLGVELGAVILDPFANGETYCRYDESIRGADIFILQTGCSPIDTNLMELLFMIQAAKLGSAKRITAVMPPFPHAPPAPQAKP